MRPTSSSGGNATPFSRVRGVQLLWDPYERLWNRNLLRKLRSILPWRPAYRAAKAVVVAVDTLLLAFQAFGQRRSDPGAPSRGRGPLVPSGMTIYYFDVGTHRDAAELSHLVTRVLPRLSQRYEAFGFEASRDLAGQARTRLADTDHVTLTHAALCFQPPANGTVKLYTGPRDGLGNSLYRREFGDYEEVPALRFSDWLKSQDLDLERNVCLLRMNIEGAEWEVVKDLVATGMIRYIDGFFGMWNDLSRIDGQADAEFRRLLGTHGIQPFTFNGRDLHIPPRMRIIEYHLRTCVRRGVQRICRADHQPTG